jgi:DNA ligase (NAD+)
MTNKTDYLNLIARAKSAAAAYYDTAEEIMTDSEYDELIDQIQALGEENNWVEGLELLESVAAGQSAGGDIEHEVKMLSLGKTSNIDVLKDFLATVSGGVLLEPKLDGLAISAIYENGKLTRIATRGNGQTGEDITNNAGVLRGLPAKIAHTDKIEIRGEVFITSSDFIIGNKNRLKFAYDQWFSRQQPANAKKIAIDDLYDIALANKAASDDEKVVLTGDKRNFYPEKEIFSNSRNAVSGVLRREKSDYPVTLDFACYDVLVDGGILGATYSERLSLVEALNVKTARQLIPQNVKDESDIILAVKSFGVARITKLTYPTDGVVLKADNLAERDRMGEGSRHPRWAMAFKYSSASKPTVVEGIELNIGRTGRLALRAKVKPVQVDGTLIGYVTLHNVSWMEEKDVRIGDTVMIRRANDVIPYLESVVLDERPASAVRWVAPEVCPQCGSDWDKSTLLWRCPSLSCGRLNSIIFAGGRDYFDWEGLSEAVITRLNDTGLVNDVADVFALTEDQLANLDMGRLKLDKVTGLKTESVLLGKTMAAKLYKQIQDSKSRPLSAVLAALGVRTLGRTFGRRLEAYYGDMGKIVSASPADLTQVEGIAIKKAEIIHAGLRERLTLIKRLAEQGVTMTSQVKKPAGTNPFTGKKIVVTGSIPGYTRGQAQELMTEIGAVASSSVSSNTNFLVADEESKGSSKYKKAESLGVKIISPEEFLKLAGK